MTQQAGAATGQNLERFDLATRLRVTTNHVPEAPARIRIQRSQINDAEQLEERLRRIIQPCESTGRGGEQHDSRFRLQRLAKLPAEVLVDVAAQSLQVLDHEDKPLAQSIRRLQNGRARLSLNVRVTPPSGQIGVRHEKFPGELRLAGSRSHGRDRTALRARSRPVWQSLGSLP